MVSDARGHGQRCAKQFFLQSRMRLEVVDKFVEILGSWPYFASKYLVKFLNCWTNTIFGRLKEFGYENVWSSWIQFNMSPTMVTIGCKLSSPLREKVVGQRQIACFGNGTALDVMQREGCLIAILLDPKSEEPTKERGKRPLEVIVVCFVGMLIFWR